MSSMSGIPLLQQLPQAAPPAATPPPNGGSSHRGGAPLRDSAFRTSYSGDACGLRASTGSLGRPPTPTGQRQAASASPAPPGSRSAAPPDASQTQRSPRDMQRPATAGAAAASGTEAVGADGGGSGTKSSSIVVAVRVRPLSDKEFARGDKAAWALDKDGNVGTVDKAGAFTPKHRYDTVFGPSADNEQVYSALAQPLIAHALQGYNGTVFAYGVTSSGKTHTMMGTDQDPGIVPRIVHSLFAEAAFQQAAGRAVTVRISMMEIYNEVLNDLLDPSRTNLKVREDARSGRVAVEGLVEQRVGSAQEALALLGRGEHNRKVGSTAFNEDSSRSHTITRIMVQASDPSTSRRTVACLDLIDLAGSESASAVLSKGQRVEGGFINRSLLTLGTVIHRLAAGHIGHLPYRDSKLTRLLQPSLSGTGARVAVVCNITPAAGQGEETANTLKFASRAKLVQITVRATEQLDDRAMLRSYRREVLDLRRQVKDLQAELAVACGDGGAAGRAADAANAMEELHGELRLENAKLNAEVLLLRTQLMRAQAYLESGPLGQHGGNVMAWLDTAAIGDVGTPASGKGFPPPLHSSLSEAHLQSSVPLIGLPPLQLSATPPLASPGGGSVRSSLTAPHGALRASQSPRSQQVARREPPSPGGRSLRSGRRTTGGSAEDDDDGIDIGEGEYTIDLGSQLNDMISEITAAPLPGQAATQQGQPLSQRASQSGRLGSAGDIAAGVPAQALRSNPDAPLRPTSSVVFTADVSTTNNSFCDAQNGDDDDDIEEEELMLHLLRADNEVLQDQLAALEHANDKLHTEAAQYKRRIAGYEALQKQLVVEMEDTRRVLLREGGWKRKCDALAQQLAQLGATPCILQQQQEEAVSYQFPAPAGTLDAAMTPRQGSATAGPHDAGACGFGSPALLSAWATPQGGTPEHQPQQQGAEAPSAQARAPLDLQASVSFGWAAANGRAAAAGPGAALPDHPQATGSAAEPPDLSSGGGQQRQQTTTSSRIQDLQSQLADLQSAMQAKQTATQSSHMPVAVAKV